MRTDGKARLWRQWIEDTLLKDILSEDIPDPVPFLQTTNDNLELHKMAGSYK